MPRNRATVELWQAWTRQARLRDRVELASNSVPTRRRSPVFLYSVGRVVHSSGRRVRTLCASHPQNIRAPPRSRVLARAEFPTPSHGAPGFAANVPETRGPFETGLWLRDWPNGFGRVGRRAANIALHIPHC